MRQSALKSHMLSNTSPSSTGISEPPTDGSQTPGYYTYMSQFVSAVRNAESALGVAAASQLSTVFMDVAWQWQNNAGNPAYIANGGNAYDSHLYYSFGAVSHTLASRSNLRMITQIMELSSLVDPADVSPAPLPPISASPAPVVVAALLPILLPTVSYYDYCPLTDTFVYLTNLALKRLPLLPW